MSQGPKAAPVEEGRTLSVTLYSRPGCHLCEEAKAAIGPLLREFGITLQEVNIDLDESLVQRYGLNIPVVFIGERKVAKHRVDIAQFRRQLLEAASSQRGNAAG